MAGKKVTFITTALNEESTITQLLTSLLRQTRLPDEVIIVDGGSSDRTVSKACVFQKRFEKENVRFIVLTRPGNRSVGRNEAIKHAKSEITVCSDAGCILSTTWLEKIVEPFQDPSVGVVAGYYEGKVETAFQRSLVPYVLVMQDKVDPETFLPASRSMGFRKKAWAAVGGFPVEFSHNEDYVFAKLLRKKGIKIAFTSDAKVYWLPRRTLREAYIMFRRFAYGDAEAGIFRPKVGFLFFRYITGAFLLVAGVLTRNEVWFALFFSLVLLYLVRYRDWETDRKSTRLNSSHSAKSRMPSSA